MLIWALIVVALISAILWWNVDPITVEDSSGGRKGVAVQGDDMSREVVLETPDSKSGGKQKAMIASHANRIPGGRYRTKTGACEARTCSEARIES